MAMHDDYANTGQCRFSLGAPVNSFGYMALALKKRNPFTKYMSLG